MELRATCRARVLDLDGDVERFLQRLAAARLGEASDRCRVRDGERPGNLESLVGEGGRKMLRHDIERAAEDMRVVDRLRLGERLA